ncbi:hypothetical protein FHG87_024925, partial [Trinorchestia longiramus]
MKIKLSKSEFFKEKLQFLGHVVSKDGITIDDSKEKMITEFPVPKSKDDVRRFIGFASYYRHFIPNFAKRANSLTEMLRDSSIFQWGEDQEAAFAYIKGGLFSKQILRYPDFTRPFVICTDASDYAIGAVLAQEYGNKLLPVSFVSRTLSETERRYSVTKKEALGV